MQAPQTKGTEKIASIIKCHKLARQRTKFRAYGDKTLSVLITIHHSIRSWEAGDHSHSKMASKPSVLADILTMTPSLARFGCAVADFATCMAMMPLQAPLRVLLAIPLLISGETLKYRYGCTLLIFNEARQVSPLPPRNFPLRERSVVRYQTWYCIAIASAKKRRHFRHSLSAQPLRLSCEPWACHFQRGLLAFGTIRVGID